MQLSTMSYRVEQGVAHVTLTRPDVANVINPAFSADLRQVMVAIEFDAAVKAVVVTANGKVFCGGGDLKLFHIVETAEEAWAVLEHALGLDAPSTITGEFADDV